MPAAGVANYRSSIYSSGQIAVLPSPGRQFIAKGYSMGTRRHGPAAALFLLFFLSGFKLWAQGPPYQIDDPVPVDYKHYEFYIFGSADGTPAEMDSTGPAFEFNWGAVPRVQLHAILPWGSVNPTNKPVYLPGGTGPQAF